MKTHRPTTHRPRRTRRREDAPASVENAAHSLEMLRAPQASGAARVGALAGLQPVIGNMAVARLIAYRSGPDKKAVATLPAPPVEVSADDQAEFNLLKGKITDVEAAAYVKHRDTYFGSTEQYRAFSVEADKELDEAKGLRKKIEFNKNPAAQNIFYRWVRMAYHKQGTTDVPAIIVRGKSEQLKTALDEISKEYGKKFQAGGFNPRPMKSAKYKYRLGTISEHALGNAVDIEAKHNAIISKADWAFVEQIAGKSVDRAEARWKDEPESLWKDITELNVLFVANLPKELARIAAELAAQTTTEPTPKVRQRKRKSLTPEGVLFKEHRDMVRWQDGFFSLDWELVKRLHAQNFKWGAVFKSSADLHHFELTK